MKFESHPCPKCGAHIVYLASYAPFDLRKARPPMPVGQAFDWGTSMTRVHECKRTRDEDLNYVIVAPR